MGSTDQGGGGEDRSLLSSQQTFQDQESGPRNSLASQFLHLFGCSDGSPEATPQDDASPPLGFSGCGNETSGSFRECGKDGIPGLSENGSCPAGERGPRSPHQEPISAESDRQEQQQREETSKEEESSVQTAALPASASTLPILLNQPNPFYITENMANFDDDNKQDVFQAAPLPIEDELRQALSHRDQTLENVLKRLTDALPTFSNLSTSDELAQDWMKNVSNTIAQISPTLSHRLTPLLQHILTQKANAALAESYVNVPVPESDLATTCSAFRVAFNSWVDAEDCVSFVVKNTALLGALSPKDYFLLTLFSMATTRRSKGDNMLMLGCTGISSCGKSTFIESTLMEGSHVYTPDAGVGRFDIQSKVILFAHDVPVDTIVTGKDSDKFRTLCRSEPTVAKSFGSTVCIPSVWVCFTSNQRLLEHSFTVQEGTRLSRAYPSQACAKPGAKRTKGELVSAMQNRFCEMYIRKKPPVDVRLLPRQGTFQRQHLVIGLYRRIVDILSDKLPCDFYSNMMCMYTISGLCKHFKTFSRVYPEESEDMFNRVECLVHNLMPKEHTRSAFDMLSAS